MEQLRRIKRIVRGQAAVDGAGVHLTRVLGRGDTTEFDPFLMLDAFDSTNPEDYTKGFPWHPHRGIETITYLIQGDIEHGDSLGNRGSILDGDCQWMTAGSGIIHQEMPQPTERMLGCQLWLNLPAKDKMAEPAYGDIKRDAIPVVTGDGSTVRILSGRYRGVDGAFQGRYVRATYLDVELAAGSEWSFENDPDETLFIYIFCGQALFDPGKRSDRPEELTGAKQAVLFGPGERLWVKAGPSGIRFILLSGNPLKEPIAWGGPIVMNTREELNLAFQELDNGKFIKKRA
ncbi:MAG: pirin family protein [Anaerolineae bacterium]